MISIVNRCQFLVREIRDILVCLNFLEYFYGITGYFLPSFYGWSHCRLTIQNLTHFTCCRCMMFWAQHQLKLVGAGCFVQVLQSVFPSVPCSSGRCYFTLIEIINNLFLNCTFSWATLEILPCIYFTIELSNGII